MCSNSGEEWNDWKRIMSCTLAVMVEKKTTGLCSGVATTELDITLNKYFVSAREQKKAILVSVLVLLFLAVFALEPVHTR